MDVTNKQQLSSNQDKAYDYDSIKQTLMESYKDQVVEKDTLEKNIDQLIQDMKSPVSGKGGELFRKWFHELKDNPNATKTIYSDLEGVIFGTQDLPIFNTEFVAGLGLLSRCFPKRVKLVLASVAHISDKDLEYLKSNGFDDLRYIYDDFSEATGVYQRSLLRKYDPNNQAVADAEVFPVTGYIKLDKKGNPLSLQKGECLRAIDKYLNLDKPHNSSVFIDNAANNCESVKAENPSFEVIETRSFAIGYEHINKQYNAQPGHKEQLKPFSNKQELHNRCREQLPKTRVIQYSDSDKEALDNSGDQYQKEKVFDHDVSVPNNSSEENKRYGFRDINYTNIKAFDVIPVPAIDYPPDLKTLDAVINIIRDINKEEEEKQNAQVQNLEESGRKSQQAAVLNIEEEKLVEGLKVSREPSQSMEENQSPAINITRSASVGGYNANRVHLGEHRRTVSLDNVVHVPLDREEQESQNASDALDLSYTDITLDDDVTLSTTEDTKKFFQVTKKTEDVKHSIGRVYRSTVLSNDNNDNGSSFQEREKTAKLKQLAKGVIANTIEELSNDKLHAVATAINREDVGLFIQEMQKQIEQHPNCGQEGGPEGENAGFSAWKDAIRDSLTKDGRTKEQIDELMDKFRIISFTIQNKSKNIFTTRHGRCYTGGEDHGMRSYRLIQLLGDGKGACNQERTR